MVGAGSRLRGYQRQAGSKGRQQNGQSHKNSPGNKQGNTLVVNARKCQTGLNKTSQ